MTCIPMMMHDTAGSGDGEVCRLLPTHLFQVQKLHGPHGALQPHASFQPQTDAQGLQYSAVANQRSEL